MELKKGVSEKKKNKGKGNGVVSCTEEGGGVVRVKIVVRKSELKQVVEMMSGMKSTMLLESSVEQRLKLLLKRKHVSTTNRNGHTCWTPVLQSIPEERLV
ncbi:hypothetical protein ACSQ67_013561 [Phaseolus vulgaris]